MEITKYYQLFKLSELVQGLDYKTNKKGKKKNVHSEHNLRQKASSVYETNKMTSNQEILNQNHY